VRVIEQEEDRIATRKVIAVGVGSLVIFAIGVALAWLLLERRTAALLPEGEPPSPPQIGQTEVGIVNQTPFGEPSKAEQRAATQHARLHSYGWVDRRRGLIHIPIERAMQLEVEESRR